MNIKFTYLLFLCSFIIFSNLSLGQNANKGIEIKGRVTDSNSQQGVEFATVLIANKLTQEAITGTSTQADGTFSVSSPIKDFFIKITFIGYKPTIINEFEIIDNQVELGVIELNQEATTLDEVVIEGEKSQTEFKLDRRIFNVGKDLSTTGVSALEVLDNVPSVNVSIEGEISLRGNSGVQILINGKPSVLADEAGNALGTITADMIEKVEVITNPSAKYDAQGTSGIINIVLKKEERKGINGSATVNTGVPHNHSFGLSLNRRTEKFNLFTQIGGGYRVRPNDVQNENRDLINNTSVLSEGEEFRNENFYNLIIGTDYHINKYNVITLSGNFAYEIEDQPSETNFAFIDENGNIESEWRREETTEATNPKWQYELVYKRDFEDNKDHSLIFSAIGSFFGKDQSSEFINTTIFGTGNDFIQETRTNFQEAQNTIKFDYTKPFTKKITLETGAQYVINDVSNDFAVSNLINGEMVIDQDQTNIFDYNQKVLGVYGTGAYEGDKWGIKLGLRVEHTDLNTLLETTNEANNQNFTNFFPSAHTSYKITETFSLQAGYSRRINRPRLWDLNPFFNIRNNFNIRVGNPDLLPEYTDSYEINSIWVFNKVSLNAGLYHLYTTDVVERISLFEEGVTRTMPFNIGTNRAYGFELNGKYTPLKMLTFFGDFNFNTFNREGTFEAIDVNFSAERWTSEITSKLKLPYDIEIELGGEYESGFETIQGEISDQVFANLGLRKKIMDGKGVFNLSVRDLFASRIFESRTNQPDFFVYNRRFRGRFLTVGFSYGFGKGEAMEFSGRKRF